MKKLLMLILLVSVMIVVTIIKPTDDLVSSADHTDLNENGEIWSESL